LHPQLANTLRFPLSLQTPSHSLPGRRPGTYRDHRQHPWRPRSARKTRRQRPAGCHLSYVRVSACVCVCARVSVKGCVHVRVLWSMLVRVRVSAYARALPPACHPPHLCTGVRLSRFYPAPAASQQSTPASGPLRERGALNPQPEPPHRREQAAFVHRSQHHSSTHRTPHPPNPTPTLSPCSRKSLRNAQSHQLRNFGQKGVSAKRRREGRGPSRGLKIDVADAAVFEEEVLSNVVISRKQQVARTSSKYIVSNT